MVLKKGDIISITKSTRNRLNEPVLAVIIQADWFNIGKPPSYIVSLISPQVYPELDFRPVIKPDSKNCLPMLSQVVIDKVQTIKSAQILNKIGYIDKHYMKDIHGCLKAILGL